MRRTAWPEGRHTPRPIRRSWRSTSRHSRQTAEPPRRRLEGGEGGGADIGPIEPASVPLVRVQTDGTHYFDIHHSAADTLAKIQPEEPPKERPALAGGACALAGRPEPPPRPPRQAPRDTHPASRPPAH